MELKYKSFIDALTQLAGTKTSLFTETQIKSVIETFMHRRGPISVTELRAKLLEIEPQIKFVPIKEKEYPLQLNPLDIGFQLRAAIALFKECN